jgi:hypothetical protein
LLGCAAHTKISDINKDPGRFAGREVTVSGHTSQSFGALSNGAFQVDDGSGTIWVVSQNFGVPGNGSKVTVTGTVQQGFNFGARSFGTVIRQTKNRK